MLYLSAFTDFLARDQDFAFRRGAELRAEIFLFEKYLI